MNIVIFLFNNLTALDIVGPYDVLGKLPNSKILFVGTEKKEYRDAHGLKILADYSLDEVSEANVLLVPGGLGIDKVLEQDNVVDWIRRIDHTTTWTTSVCSGALLLAQAGLLDGKRCTTHWNRKKQLQHYDVTILNERYVQDGKIITSAGVSAGIDMALFLASIIASDQIAKKIQLRIEYDPKSPFDCGTPDKAPKDILDSLTNIPNTNK